MPFSRHRSGSASHLPLFRSLSANAVHDPDKDKSKVEAGEASGPASGGLASTLSTLSSLANLNLHRRSRTRSNAKRNSHGNAQPPPPTHPNHVQTHEQSHTISNLNVTEHQGHQQHNQQLEVDTGNSDSPPNNNLDIPRPEYSRTTTNTTTNSTSTAGTATSFVSAALGPSASVSATALAATPPSATDSPGILGPPSSTPSPPTGASHHHPDAQATPTHTHGHTGTSSSSFFAPVASPSTLSATTTTSSSSTPIASSLPTTSAITTKSANPPPSICQTHPPSKSLQSHQQPTQPSTDTSFSPTTIPPDTKIHVPPPLLVVQQPSTPTVPILNTAPLSHDNLPAMPKKIWVKRPGASPTRVEVAEDDLVDNVRDVILRKYANSLGRSIDSPDITLRILSREPHNKNIPAERTLSPDESIIQTLELYYPGGQTVDEALLIDVPARRTPRASPRAGNHQIQYYYASDQYRPDDAAREYFPPMPVQSPHLAHVQHQNSIPHAMSILATGQPPLLPSPGSHTTRRRPKYPRQHTSSPTILHTVQPNGQVIESKAQINGTVPNAPPLPTPPAQPNELASAITPPGRPVSPHAGHKPKRKKLPNPARSASGEAIPSVKPAASSLLDGSVPPINVLLVEDNNINLKLLEAFMKRLKVRWKSAVNGKEAVTMWKTGGFHLVLMDIQLPVMNGLEATKEIRRLEAVNGIGVFSVSPMEHGLKMANKNNGPVSEEDALPDKSLFKSPVIIVALTASSLQSDRHEALAAGCNDFLTKPVNFVWMERKVTEWGCMQALIDFDGWRKWKQYADEKAKEDPAKRAAEEKEEKAKAKAALKAMFARPPPSTKKDSASSVSTATSEKTTTPSQNGTIRKPAGSPGAQNEDRRPRSHKSSRSTTSIGDRPGGNLESMAEVDEKGP